MAGAPEQQSRPRGREPAEGQRLRDATVLESRRADPVALHRLLVQPAQGRPDPFAPELSARRRLGADQGVAARGAAARRARAHRGEPLPHPEGSRSAGGTLLVSIAGQGGRR